MEKRLWLLGSRWGFLSAPDRSCKVFGTPRSENGMRCFFGDACFGICLELEAQTSAPRLEWHRRPVSEGSAWLERTLRSAHTVRELWRCY